MLSIIIPTLNEENYLLFLLGSIKNQNFEGKGEEDKSSSSPTEASAEVEKKKSSSTSPSLGGSSLVEEINLFSASAKALAYEVIVADAGSKDKTLEIAKNYGCKIIPGGLPAKGRNNGAKVAKGDLLLFLDADVILPDNFLKKSLEEFEARKLKVASYGLIPRTEHWVIKMCFDVFYNWPIILWERILAYGAMGILVEKEIFEKVGGFEEEIKLAEDHYFVRQGAKIGRFGIIRSVKIYISLRRYQEDGYLKTWFKYFVCQMHMIFLGPVRSDIFNYRFGHYSKTDKNKV